VQDARGRLTKTIHKKESVLKRAGVQRGGKRNGNESERNSLTGKDMSMGVYRNEKVSLSSRDDRGQEDAQTKNLKSIML